MLRMSFPDKCHTRTLCCWISLSCSIVAMLPYCQVWKETNGDEKNTLNNIFCTIAKIQYWKELFWQLIIERKVGKRSEFFATCLFIDSIDFLPDVSCWLTFYDREKATDRISFLGLLFLKVNGPIYVLCYLVFFSASIEAKNQCKNVRLPSRKSWLKSPFKQANIVANFCYVLK